METQTIEVAKKSSSAGIVIGIIAGIIVLGGVGYVIYRLSKNGGTWNPVVTGDNSSTNTTKTITTKADAVTQLVSSLGMDAEKIGKYDEAYLIAWAKATLGTGKTFTYLNKTYSAKGGYACTASNPC